MRKLIILSAIVIFMISGCAFLQTRAPTFKTAEYLSYAGQPLPFLIPEDLPDFTEGDFSMGMISLELAYLSFVLDDSPTQYLLVAMINCPKILALMVINGEDVQRWIYNDQGEPVPASAEEIKALIEAPHGCPAKTMEAA